jgi:hypothetical protein
MNAKTLIAAAATAMIGIAAFAAPAAATEYRAAPVAKIDVTYNNHGYNGGVTIYFGSKHNKHNYGYKKHVVRYCTEERALWKARDFGIRHAHVVHANKHSITVKGRKHGYKVAVKFGRDYSCPVYASY